TLRGGLPLRSGAGVRVDLTGDEEEVVAGPVQGEADEQPPLELPGIAQRAERIAAGPGDHADEQCRLHPVALEEYRQQQHEEELGGLPECLLACCVRNVDLRQELVGILIVERERHADQNRSEEEYREVTLAQHVQGIEAEQAAQAALAPCR